MTRLSGLVLLTVDFQYSAMVVCRGVTCNQRQSGKAYLAHGAPRRSARLEKTSSHSANHGCGSFTALHPQTLIVLHMSSSLFPSWSNISTRFSIFSRPWLRHQILARRCDD